ncbi:hypothetical protein BH11BAC3_BH11BAC3_06290 [soil metagenome]
MKHLLTTIILLGLQHYVPAQVGSSVIGTSSIGTGSLFFPKIGKATTPTCSTPGTCGNSCIVYTFTGAGNWNLEANWEGSAIPPVVLTGCSQILIAPSGSNECILNIPVQVIPAGNSITVMSGKKFRVPGNIVIQKGGLN